MPANTVKNVPYERGTDGTGQAHRKLREALSSVRRGVDHLEATHIAHSQRCRIWAVFFYKDHAQAAQRISMASFRGYDNKYDSRKCKIRDP